MKKLILTMLVGVMLAGCTVHVPATTEIQVNDYDCHTDTIENCEYLICGNGYSQMMSHKGNCKNHRHER